jgi:hypothetical protein
MVVEDVTAWWRSLLLKCGSGMEEAASVAA